MENFMLTKFFYTLKQYQVPVSVREYLDLINALDQGLAFADNEDFYRLSRVCLVKDEKHFDKFDRAFKHFFDGLDTLSNPLDSASIPDDWLRKEIEKTLSPEELEQLQKMGSLEKLMEEFENVCKNNINAIKVAIKWSARVVHRLLVRMARIPKVFV